MALPFIKVCGITRESDVETCLAAGVRWIGINLYEPSPRSVTLERAQELFAVIPAGQRVLVDVDPGIQRLQSCKTAGFDRFQLHFKPDDLSISTLQSWADLLGPENLWLAPKLPPTTDFPTDLLAFAGTIVLDAYSKDAFGGTGKTGNWSLFRKLRIAHPNHIWILAGGLNPENIRDAVQATGTEAVDLNSGIETAPGLKDSAKLQSALQALG